MSIEQVLRSSQGYLQALSVKRPWWRLLLLCMLLLLSIGSNVLLIVNPDHGGRSCESICTTLVARLFTLFCSMYPCPGNKTTAGALAVDRVGDNFDGSAGTTCHVVADTT